MLDLGAWGEFLFIIIVAVIILKPNDLPKIMATIARMIKKIRRFYSNVQQMFTQLAYTGQLHEDNEKKSQYKKK